MIRETYRVGVDVGGTFTDLVAIDGAGRTIFVKSPSTPSDQSVGVIDGLSKLAARLSLELPELLGRTERLVHGTTVATNALLERKGARVGLLTTSGHRDILEMREGLKEDRYNLRLPAPEPLVPRYLRLGVRERLRADGSVLEPLDPNSLGIAIEALKAAGVEAVAVCYLHAYRNPKHEAQSLAAIEREMPRAFVSLSSDVLPQIKEFERVSTTVVNAYVGPVVRRYFTSLKLRLSDLGYRGGLFIMLSHGGVAPIEEAGRLAVGTVLSGPAGGVAGSRLCAELLGLRDLIPFDMGGTSTDISLIADGLAALTTERGLSGQKIALRSLDIASIGAGGGSIARVAPGGMLRVGPESAGSEPGPACYGQGGEAATVTDANLLLGYLSAENFLGGAQRLDRPAAEATIARVAGKLGIEPIAAAAGIHRLINLIMADGIRLMTVRRGVDPRRFALLSFGGAAGLHAVEVARQLDIPRVIVPRIASVLSAWGMLGTELRYEVSRTHIGDASSLGDADLRALFADMESEAEEKTKGWFDLAPRLQRSAEMRYGEQIYEIDVPLNDLDWDAPDLSGRIVAKFHARHEDVYTYASPDQEVVLVNARLSVVGGSPGPLEEPRTTPPAMSRPALLRRAYFDGWREVRVFDMDTLRPGTIISGPAIVEAETTTVVFNEGDVARVDARGWLAIDLGAAPNASRAG
ncbi:MAG: hydantoinase/oxoprolinase family protein [Hyphomicrobiales bacterium]